MSFFKKGHLLILLANLAAAAVLLFVIGYTCALAWVVSFLVYQTGNVLIHLFT